MPKHRNASLEAKFEYRREHPDKFRYVCKTCVPERRFELIEHKNSHDRKKHGSLIPAATHSFAYSLPQSLPTSSVSACSPTLSSISATELNLFVQMEIEPDTAYNQSCKAVVDRLCQFMQNNFPDQLRPSEVRKVIFLFTPSLNMYHFFFKLGMDGHCHIPYKSLEKEEL